MSASKEYVEDTISDKSVYSLPNRPCDNIVDFMLKIIDVDGPEPMKNFKPTTKINNGADLFYIEHQNEYEARGHPGRDKVGTVHAHNRACPKMYDELHKRRSTAHPVPFIPKRNTVSDTNLNQYCSACAKLKKLEHEALRKCIHIKSRHHRRSRTSSKLRLKSDIKTKIKKHNEPRRSYRNGSIIIELSKFRKNQGRQFKTSRDVPAEMVNVSSNNDNCIEPSQEVTSLLSPQQSKKQYGNKKPSKSDNESGKPDTNSRRSVSSYNSFMSMEHEPMVE